jgi:hypothetical protein
MDKKIKEINGLIPTSVSDTDSLAHCMPTSVRDTDLCNISIYSCLYATAVAQNVMAYFVDKALILLLVHLCAYFKHCLFALLIYK